MDYYGAATIPPPIKLPDPIATGYPSATSVGIPVTFRDYITTDWIGTTNKAEAIRNGYCELEKAGYSHLLPIRGDNYCAIRSTLFQTFSMEQFNQCLLADMKAPKVEKMNIAPMFERFPILNEWTFANKEEFRSEGSPQEVLELCIGSLALEVEQIRLRPKRMDRMLYFYDNLNTKKELYDYSLMESIKYFMFVKVAEFWELYKKGEKLPNGMDHFFLRETASSLEDYFRNHLNQTGDTGGLEMIEMFLLGYALGLQIRVVRLSSFGNEDFISCYPPGDYPVEKVITISSEDDRHYNVIATLDNMEEFLKYLTLP